MIRRINVEVEIQISSEKEPYYYTIPIDDIKKMIYDKIEYDVFGFGANVEVRVQGDETKP